MIKYLLVILTFVGAVLAAPSSSPLITSHLESALMGGGRANIFIALKADTSTVLSNIKNARFENRSAKLNALYVTLQDHAETTQKPILNFLEQSRISQVTSFWINNQIYVKDADRSLVSSLVDKFANLIANIDQEFFAHIIKPVKVKANVSLSSDINYEWGVNKIQAPEAWEHLGGLTKAGEGVIIATIDTGVRGTHEALRDNFVGEYGWFDPSPTKTPVPTDDDGHGTHTTGTIAGSRGIGVAPNAKWAACRGCDTFFCFQSDLFACGQFLVCPTLPDGSNPDCSRAPHLVANSWGGGRGNTWFNSIIEAWHAGGIIPVFSIGNSGPDCNTANSPGDQNVIGVGSTTITDSISSFSSVGPTTDGRMKPEIVAPGSDVVSAFHRADNAYVSLSGTSMACPHVAGTIALLQTRNKQLTYQEARNFLFEQADRNLVFSGLVCEGVGDDKFPNHVFGNGRINALKSVRAQTEQMR